jgi:hypothetical protein
MQIRASAFTGVCTAWPASVFDYYATVDAASEFMTTVEPTTEAVISQRWLASGAFRWSSAAADPRVADRRQRGAAQQAVEADGRAWWLASGPLFFARGEVLRASVIASGRRRDFCMRPQLNSGTLDNPVEPEQQPLTAERILGARDAELASLWTPVPRPSTTPVIHVPGAHIVSPGGDAHQPIPT